MIWDEITSRLQPTCSPTVDRTLVIIALAVAAAVVFVPPIWRLVRIAVTIVHELGHAIVGVLGGRRFTGFVLRPDMSGETITVGKTRGPALILSTWAGYPAPAIIGTTLVFAAERGWSAPVVAAAGVVFLGTLVMVRSFYTALVIVLSLAATAALWWWGAEDLQLVVLLAVGVILLLGAWRHIGSVSTRRARKGGSDPGALARLTPVPSALWVLSFAAVAAAGSAVVLLRLWNLLKPV